METLESPPPGLQETPPHAPQGSVFREVPWRWSDLLIGLAPSVTARVVSLAINPIWVPPSLHWVLLPVMLLLSAWLIGFPSVMARRRCGARPQFPRLRSWIVESLWALLALPLVLIAVNLVLLLVLPYLTGGGELPRTPVEHLARSPNRFDALALMILAVSVVPVGEEIFFRGMLYNGLRQRLPLIVAVLLQAVIFGWIHPFDLGNTIGVIVFGMGFAIVYAWRKTLLTPVILHAMVNAFMMIVISLNMAAEANAPTLGVIGDPAEGGCRLTTVVPGSAAEAAGLQVGDVITAADGSAVSDIVSLAKVVRSKQAGQPIAIDFRRGEAAHRAEAVLKTRRETDESRR